MGTLETWRVKETTQIHPKPLELSQNDHTTLIIHKVLYTQNMKELSFISYEKTPTRPRKINYVQMSPKLVPMLILGCLKMLLTPHHALTFSIDLHLLPFDNHTSYYAYDDHIILLGGGA